MSKYERHRFDVVTYKGLTGTLLFTIIVAAFGSAFQHGYNTGVVNAPEKVIESWITEIITGSRNDTAKTDHRVKLIYSTVVSIFCFGGMVGGLLTNLWTHFFGMKFGVIMNNFFIFLAAALMGFAKQQASYVMLILGRFFVGVNSGLNAGLVPMYLSELPPKSLRGGVGSVYQLFLTISILISQLLSAQQVLGNESHWPMLFSLVIMIPAILQILLLPFCADSPRYLNSVKRDDDVQSALRWLRKKEDVQTELDTIKSETEAASKMPKVDYNQLFMNPSLRKPLIISCVIMLSQQFSGINAVIFYSTSSFELAKLNAKEAQLGTTLMGMMNVAMTVISTLIVDKAGRKTLLTVGFGLMFIDTILLFIFLTLSKMDSIIISYSCIAFVVLYVVFFAIGPGSIPWFMVSEFFLPNARPLAISIAVATNWIANFVVGLTFPIFQEALHSYVFLIFVVLQLIFLVYIILTVPETKNRDITEITAEFSSKN